MKTNTSKKVLRLDEKYFWDIDFHNLDQKKHRKFIISRIIERGNWPDFKSLINYYGFKQVKDDIIQLRYMDKKSLRFCSFYFKVPQEKFRCYRSMH